jgi:elongation factor G
MAAMPREQTSFRETITTSAEAEGRFMRQTGGRGQHGVVRLRIEPLARGQGFEFVKALDQNVLPEEFIKPVEEGVREAMEQGLLKGYPMTDLRVTLLGGSYTWADSTEMAFKVAGAIGFKEAARKANPIVLELDAS